MTNEEPKPVVIVTGGGTGGHVYPGLGVVEAISAIASPHYVGHPDRLEGRVVPAANVPFHPLRSRPMGGGPLQKVALALSLAQGVARALFLIGRLRPKLVIGVGGYVSVPMVVAAWIARRPILLHEQNVAPGLANRTLSSLTKAPVMTAFPVAEGRLTRSTIIETGCSVRQSFGSRSHAEARREMGIEETRKVVLIVGGSGGAPAINLAALAIAELTNQFHDLLVLHATGRKYYDVHCAAARAAGLDRKEAYRILDYLDDSSLYMSASDIIVARSGASTLNEIFCSGLPSVLIPSPNVAEDHQLANAQFAADHGAALVVEEVADYAGAARQAVAELLDDEPRRQAMARAAEANCRGREAAQRIAAEVAARIGGGKVGGGHPASER